jgi:hypothetical protein
MLRPVNAACIAHAPTFVDRQGRHEQIYRIDPLPTGKVLYDSPNAKHRIQA